MKTFAHIDAGSNIVGIGKIYYENGSLTNGVSQFIANTDLELEAGIVAYGEHVRPKMLDDDDLFILGPSVVDVVLIDTEDMPGDDPDSYDKTFRGAFKKGESLSVTIDMDRAKEIAHVARRLKRDNDFAPLDIKATIPREAVQAEADRQIIRDKGDRTQIDVNLTDDPITLKQLMIDNDWI